MFENENIKINSKTMSLSKKETSILICIIMVMLYLEATWFYQDFKS